MVLKKSKFNTNTGNTLRRVRGCSSKGIARAFKSEGYIIKDKPLEFTKGVKCTKDGQSSKLGPKKGKRHRKNHMSDEDYETDLLQGVPYSLNKKRRWLFANEIKENFNSSEQESAQVVLFATNQGFCGNRGRRRQKIWSDKSNCSNTVPDQENITYTIVHHADTSGTFLTLSNAKKFNHDGNRAWLRDGYLGDANRCLTVKRKKWHRNYSNYYDDCDDHDDGYNDGYEVGYDEKDKDCSFGKDFEHAYEYEYREPEEDNFVYVSRNCEVNDERDLPHAVSKTVLASANKSYNKSEVKEDITEVFKNRALMYDGNLEKIIQQLGEMSCVNADHEIQCLVECKKISGKYLERYFGKQFCEGNSEPRKFCIFDEEVVANGRYAAVTVTAVHTDKAEVFIKAYNIPQNVAQYFRHETDDQSFELVLDLCFNLEKLMAAVTRSLPATKTANRITYEGDKFDLIPSGNVWFNILHDFKRRANVRTTKQEEEGINRNMEDTFMLVNSGCPVCSSEKDITYIESCGHYLCDCCWKGYIDNKLSTGCMNIPCPEEKCAKHLELGFILLHSSKDQVCSFVQKCIEGKVKETTSMQLCPHKSCSAVAVCKSDDPNTNHMVQCICRGNWCFGCLNQVHWPASCDAYKSYKSSKHQTKGESRDFEGHLIQKYVVVKMCPGCKYPIEKFEGCDHMICICGANFCWRCCTRYKGARLREEALEHRCNISHPMKFLFGHLNTLYTISKTSVEWTDKADAYADHITQLKSKKKKGTQKFFSCDVEEKNRVDVVNLRVQLLTLLMNIYKLLEKICIETAHRDTKHLRSRVKLFIGNVKLQIKIEKGLDVYQPSIHDYAGAKYILKHCLCSVTDFAHGLCVSHTV